MRIFVLCSLLIVCQLLGCSSNPPKTVPLVVNKVIYSSNAVIREAIINECDLPNTLSNSLKAATESQYPQILDNIANVDDADLLNVEITHAEGTGGGAWTGPKSVAIKANLIRHGKVVGDFKGSRIADAGGYGTCAILQRSARRLGQDIADWLQNPMPNAVLK